MTTHKMVPREATQGMHLAAEFRNSLAPSADNFDLWRAMYDAAPAARPKSEPTNDGLVQSTGEANDDKCADNKSRPASHRSKDRDSANADALPNTVQGDFSIFGQRGSHRGGAEVDLTAPAASAEPTPAASGIVEKLRNRFAPCYDIDHLLYKAAAEIERLQNQNDSLTRERDEHLRWRGDLANKLHDRESRLAEATAIIFEIDCAGVEFDAGKYLTIQLQRETLYDARAFLAASAKE